MPKWSQNAWSELQQIGCLSSLPTSSWLVGPKGAFTSSQAAHFEILYSPFEPQFQYLQLLWHYRQCIFDLQSSSHSSINELCCPQLVYQTLEHTVGFDVHHSLFTISDHISHVGSLSLFSKFPLIRVSNTRTYN